MSRLRWLLVLVLLVLLPCNAIAQDCLSGTVTAEETPPGSGVWKYTATLTYDVTVFNANPRHFKLTLGALAACNSSCGSGQFAFALPAGRSPGTDRLTDLPGTVEYEGGVECGDDSTLPQFPGTSIKWKAPDGATIEPNLAGTGTFAFYSLLPPGPIAPATATIRLGKGFCGGTMTGALPVCDCATPVRTGTWGRLKVLYR